MEHPEDVSRSYADALEKLKKSWLRWLDVIQARLADGRVDCLAIRQNPMLQLLKFGQNWKGSELIRQ